MSGILLLNLLNQLGIAFLKGLITPINTGARMLDSV